VTKIHLDTDLGGDIDDLCALALLLRWPDALDLMGITVVGDTNGRRTGMVHAALQAAGRDDIPVAAGADTAGGYYPYPFGNPPEARYWPEPIVPSFNPLHDALSLLKRGIDQGATVIGIGPYTNLYLLETQFPGILMQTDLYLMGGYVYPPRPGFPAWRNEDDFNVQVDVRSSKGVLQHSQPTLIPLAVTVETALRHSQLARLEQGGGALGQLIARQAREFAVDEKLAEKLVATCSGLPHDIINFQHDGLACAVALGWREGVVIEELPLVVEEVDGVLVQRIDPAGRPFRVVTQVDGARFDDFWLDIMVGSKYHHTP
jgi:inosine-uridine nucleoside N-ribohydrolase